MLCLNAHRAVNLLLDHVRSSSTAVISDTQIEVPGTDLRVLNSMGGVIGHRWWPGNPFVALFKALQPMAWHKDRKTIRRYLEQTGTASWAPTGINNLAELSAGTERSLKVRLQVSSISLWKLIEFLQQLAFLLPMVAPEGTEPETVEIRIGSLTVPLSLVNQDTPEALNPCVRVYTTDLKEFRHSGVERDARCLALGMHQRPGIGFKSPLFRKFIVPVQAAAIEMADHTKPLPERKALALDLLAADQPGPGHDWRVRLADYVEESES